MASPGVSREDVNDAVKAMIDIGIPRETVLRVLKKLLTLYDNNWVHIKADNYRALADAIFDDSDPTEGQKRGQKNNLDSDHCNKKLKMKDRGQKVKSNIHGNGKREPTEVPPQQEAGGLEQKAFKTQLQKPSSQKNYKEPKIETNLTEAITIGESSAFQLGSSDNHNFQTPLAVMCPEVLEPSIHKGHKDALMVSGVDNASGRKFKEVSTSHEGHMPDAYSSQGIVSNKDFPAMEFLSKYSVPQPLQLNQSSSSRMLFNNLTRFSSTVVAGVNQSNSSNMQIIQHELHTGVKKQSHDVNDITKGQESVCIPIVNGVDGRILPPPFNYIPHNITFQDAYINLSLARIGDENCCSECFGDCLAEPLTCACATETGGEFAYTRDGLLKEGFLDACIALLQDPAKHHYFYCKICPIERNKIEVNSESPIGRVNPDPCKGHLIRKFIKECWSKCGCSRNCGNRVVQRGITRSLQVFFTSKEKGWGLRTAEILPRGAFVCEYVGEILTNIELHERNTKSKNTGNEKHTYPLLLDADWGTEGVLKDEEALCLDGTFYGNVARFINHRCFDGNIIAVPVEIETPDHHYYHLAFFTKRQIEPFEELTWDYEIDFDDVNHPIKAFKCHCGSEFCRDKSRISRGSKDRAQVLTSSVSRGLRCSRQ